MSRFTLTLPSNSSMTYNPNNTASQYTTKLNEVIELNGNWEVGLLETSFPHRVHNVTDDDHYMMIKLTRSGRLEKLVLPLGNYTDPDTIFNALHAAERNVFNIPESQRLFVLLRAHRSPSQDRIFMKLTVTVDEDVPSVGFSEPLARMLGFESVIWYGPQRQEYRNVRATVLTDRFDSQLYIYCDLLEHVIVGDTKAPLLRIVNRSIDGSEKLTTDHRTYNPILYVPLQKKCFDTVTINMMTDTGTPIPFVDGKSIVVLEFRRITHPYLFI